MTFAAIDSALTGPLFATEAMRAAFSDRSRLAAILRAEAALARAEARYGFVDKALAPAIEAIAPGDLDSDALGREIAVSGIPIIPFARAVEAKLPERLRGGFHYATTTQDIVDTALALQMAAAFRLIAGDLDAILAGLSRLARRHRLTPCAGRTLGQHAAPVSFGYVAALWLAGIAEVASSLVWVREAAEVVSLSGPVGTLAGLGDKGQKVVAAMARELGLGAPAIGYHVRRARLVKTGTWLATLIGALAKMAADVSRLAASEIGEVAEPTIPGRGGSSAMPHKRNPVASIVILAAQAAAKGHVVTLLDAMAAEYQRPVGLWHAEWHALPQLFGLASGALREARTLAEGLVVDPGRMRENLEASRGLLAAGSVASALAAALGRKEAHALVERAAERVRETGRPLGDILAGDAAIPEGLRGTVEAALDIAPAIAAAADVVDRALAEARPVRAVLRKMRKA
jgi:3-carboxy-cis,cis-muconate cycloisomerase